MKKKVLIKRRKPIRKKPRHEKARRAAKARWAKEADQDRAVRQSVRDKQRNRAKRIAKK